MALISCLWCIPTEWSLLILIVYSCPILCLFTFWLACVIYTQSDVSADHLYILLRNLSWYLPLPPLPTIAATTMCRILTARLHLPEYFNKMVEKTLRCIESPAFDGAFVHPHRTFDIQCMGIIIFLLRMIYFLDDINELWVVVST